MLDLGLYVLYVLLAIAVIAAIVFPIIQAVKTPGAVVRSLIGIGALLLLFGIGYALSDSSVPTAQRGLYSEGAIKLMSAGLIMFYVTLVLAALAVVYSEITKAFSNG